MQCVNCLEDVRSLDSYYPGLCHACKCAWTERLVGCLDALDVAYDVLSDDVDEWLVVEGVDGDRVTLPVDESLPKRETAIWTLVGYLARLTTGGDMDEVLPDRVHPGSPVVRAVTAGWTAAGRE